MKKILSLLAVIICFAASAMAQPYAIGVRVGQNLEISYQQICGNSGMLQVDLGGYAYRGFQGTITYSWRSSINGSSASGTWTSYGGFGVGGGYAPCGRNYDPYFVENLSANKGRTTAWFLSDDDYSRKLLDGRKYDLYSYGFIGLAGLVGFEYEFSSVPLALAFEYRPLFGVDMGSQINYQRPDKTGKFGVRFHTPGLWDVGVALRYLF